LVLKIENCWFRLRKIEHFVSTAREGVNFHYRSVVWLCDHLLQLTYLTAQAISFMSLEQLHALKPTNVDTTASSHLCRLLWQEWVNFPRH
jgi:hypothetical protein